MKFSLALQSCRQVWEIIQVHSLITPQGLLADGFWRRGSELKRLLEWGMFLELKQSKPHS